MKAYYDNSPEYRTHNLMRCSHSGLYLDTFDFVNIVILAVITRFTVNSFVKKKCYSKENWEGVCVP